jgi:hypothetical protein
MTAALAKLTALRIRLRRFQQLRMVLKNLHSPGREKALTFLGDCLPGSTSNAVERGNSRHRKRQKTVYRVHTPATIRGGIALDMFRDAQGTSRGQTMKTLHKATLTSGDDANDSELGDFWGNRLSSASGRRALTSTYEPRDRLELQSSRLRQNKCSRHNRLALLVGTAACRCRKLGIL